MRHLIGHLFRCLEVLDARIVLGACCCVTFGGYY